MKNQTIDEQLSALIDGELPIGQDELLLARLDRDPELRLKLGRYSMIGDVLKDSQIHLGALQVADRVREQLLEEPAPIEREQRKVIGSGGLWGAGLAAAVAMVVALNLNPTGDETVLPQLAGVVPANVVTTPVDQLRANVAPERMTRYLVTHSAYANSASRQFVDSHLVMPAFQRAAWQTTGSR